MIGIFLLCLGLATADADSCSGYGNRHSTATSCPVSLTGTTIKYACIAGAGIGSVGSIPSTGSATLTCSSGVISDVITITASGTGTYSISIGNTGTTSISSVSVEAGGDFCAYSSLFSGDAISASRGSSGEYDTAQSIIFCVSHTTGPPAAAPAPVAPIPAPVIPSSMARTLALPVCLDSKVFSGTCPANSISSSLCVGSSGLNGYKVTCRVIKNSITYSYTIETVFSTDSSNLKFNVVSVGPTGVFNTPASLFSAVLLFSGNGYCQYDNPSNDSLFQTPTTNAGKPLPLGHADFCFNTVSGIGGAVGDPWVEGYLGQHFYIEGPNAWYAMVSDARVQLNLYMQKFDDQYKQMYWTKASLQHFSADGLVQQSFLLETLDHTAQSVSCDAVGASSPCIGNGGVLMTVNGEKRTAPGEFETGSGFHVSVANLPKACKLYTKTYAAQHPDEERRGLASTYDLLEFTTSRDLFSQTECLAWVAEQSKASEGIFSAEGENSLFILTTPSLTVSLEYYKYFDEGFQYYRLDVSALDYVVNDISEPQGVVAETMRAHYDEEGNMRMTGQVLKALTTDYIVETAEGRDFTAKFLAEDNTPPAAPAKAAATITTAEDGSSPTTTTVV